jgi:hypothetical protein
MAKPTTDAPPTAARALEILEAPERARRAAAAAEEAERGLKARQAARPSLEQRLSLLGQYRAEFDTWSAQQPRLGEVGLDVFGSQPKLYFDRMVAAGVGWSERLGRAEAEAQRLSAALDQPLVGPPLGEAVQAVFELENREPNLKAARERWRGQRANIAKEFGHVRSAAAALERWMSLEAGTS